MPTSSLITADYQDHPVTFTEDGWLNATALADQFGKRLDHYFANVETKAYIDVLCEESNTRNPGDFVRTQRGRNGGTWIHSDLAVHFARWLDLRFAVWCDRQIKTILSGTHPHIDWKRARHSAAASGKVMHAVLQLLRQEQGKPTAAHHYSNEARLVNWALTGEFKALDRDQLTDGDLALLATLEETNTVLIGLGWTYADRKLALERRASDARQSLMHRTETAA